MDDHIGCATLSEEKAAKKRSKSNVQCSVFGCQGRSNVGLYKLPDAVKDPIRRNKWIIALRMGKVKKYVNVCGKHFVEEDFKPQSDRAKGKIKRLKETAIPSRNLPKSAVQKSPSNAKKASIKNRSVLASKRSLLLESLFHKHVPEALSNDSTTSISPNNIASQEDDSAAAANSDADKSDENLENTGRLLKDASLQVNTLIGNYGVKFIDIVSNDEAILTCTGIPSFEKFEQICAAVELFCHDLNLTYGQRSYKLCIRERVLLTL
ncbi:uncharacterized protein LOC135845740 [Planococcus citri]|uniref:uncharacterized protein LOC135844734 n=1 Tax=Planococcus citri TaxID=170843 RepID=UPI0031F98D1E